MNRAPAKINGATVLVVDNSPANVAELRAVYSSRSDTGIIAAKGVDEAMALLRERPPDVILSDVHMPMIDGFDFIKLIKADVELRKIPFVLISSTVWGGGERDPGLSLGAAQFIIRPIETQALVDQIEACRNAKPQVE